MTIENSVSKKILASDDLESWSDPRLTTPEHLKKIVVEYNRLLDIYSNARESISEGKSRDEAGKLFEGVVDYMITNLDNGYRSIIGRNDFLTINAGNTLRDNLQVDRHIVKNDNNQTRVAFVECKTYLDSPYLLRAVFNMWEITKALEQIGESTENVKFIVFAGQNAVSQQSTYYFQYIFKEMTGSNLDIFFINSVKSRSSSRPLYEFKYQLDLLELQRFLDLFFS